MKTASESEQNQAHFASLRHSKTALLTSFRRNGQGIGTPIRIRVAGDKAYFTTWSTTGKIKRLANNPRVTLAPYTQQGKPLGPTVGGKFVRREKKARKPMAR